MICNATAPDGRLHAAERGSATTLCGRLASWVGDESSPVAQVDCGDCLALLEAEMSHIAGQGIPEALQVIELTLQHLEHDGPVY